MPIESHYEISADVKSRLHRDILHEPSDQAYKQKHQRIIIEEKWLYIIVPKIAGINLIEKIA